MKFREKLALEHPEFIDDGCWGGCQGCPSSYKYEESIMTAPCWQKTPTIELCTECWGREIPGTEPTSLTVIEHDGCVMCEYFDKEEPDYPCNECKGTAIPGTVEHDTRKDLFEPRVPKGGVSIKPKEEVDWVNAPPHYLNGIECIDELIAVFGKEVVADFCLCNVWKYRKRALHKNGQEDLDKADWYMKKFMELEGKLPQTDPMIKLP